jgi:hypothetical protein
MIGSIDQLHAAVMQSVANATERQRQKERLIALLHRLKAAANKALKIEYSRDSRLRKMPVTM